jgi:hypothetical protein
VLWDITKTGKYKDLRGFSGTITVADGKNGYDCVKPFCSVAIDAHGNLFGTASAGGADNCGMIWEMTSTGIYKDLYDFGFDVPYAGVIVGGSKLTFPSRT